MPRVSVDNNDRFTMQIPPLAKARLIRAATIENTTLKEFMLRNSLQAAEAVIERVERIELSERDSRRFLELLADPGEPNEHMVAILKEQLSS